MSNSRTFAVAIACLGACLSQLSAQPAAQAPGQAADPGAPANGYTIVADEVIIHFKANAIEQDQADAEAAIGFTEKKHLHTPAMKAAGHPGLHLGKTKVPAAQAIEILRKHPAVEFAEPNYVYQHQAIANDPYFSGGYLWGMEGDASAPANQYGSQAAEAWSAGYTGSRSVYVGIIDQGIQFTQMQDINPNSSTNRPVKQKWAVVVGIASFAEKRLAGDDLVMELLRGAIRLSIDVAAQRLAQYPELTRCQRQLA